MSARISRFTLGLIAGLALGFQPAAMWADSVMLTSAADTTLIESAPDYNLGGALIVNAGTTQTALPPNRNRGLFRFDLTNQIPRGSRIARVDLVLEVTGQPKDGFTPSSFGLHRVLKSWGQGTKASPDPTHPGLGAPATAGEATWNSRFALSTNTWTIPGGGATNDFAAEVSAETAIYGVGDSPYTFASTPGLVADVQVWLDDPAANFGWMLICQAEQANFTARRFASHEDMGHAPYLVIEYTPLKIDLVTVTNGELNLSFAARASQTYAVEFRTGLSLANNWSTFTNVPAQPSPTNVVVTDPISETQRFYRLRLP